MFRWFKKAKKSVSPTPISKSISLQPSQNTSTDQTSSIEKNIQCKTQAAMLQSNLLHQKRQKNISAFDPWHPDLKNLDCSPLTSVEIAFLKKIANQPVKDPYIAGYWQYEYQLSFPVIMNRLLGNNYLKISSAADVLSYLTIPELKDILRKTNLPVSGKKSELICRIQKNISQAQLISCITDLKAHYVLTEKGNKLVATLSDSITKDIDFEDACLAAIHESNINKAYHLICQREAEKAFPRGIGIDWEAQYHKGLDNSEVHYYTIMLNRANDLEKTYLECLLLCHLLGKNNPSPLLHRIVGKRENTSAFSSARHTFDKFRSTIELARYQSRNLLQYEILCAMDQESCPLCRSLHKKRFLVSEAEVGVNFPPFCQTCRCTTLPVFDAE